MYLNIINKKDTFDPVEKASEIEYRRKRKLGKTQIENLKKSLLYIARNICPKDTKNMAENAIYAKNTHNGFSIIWDNRFAYYMPYVDKGINPLYPNSPKVKANKDFVARSIAFMASYCSFYFSENKDELKGLQALFDKVIKAGKSRGKTTTINNMPLFIKMWYDVLEGKSISEVTKNKGDMLYNLFKSMREYATNKTKENEIINFMEEYNIYN